MYTYFLIANDVEFEAANVVEAEEKANKLAKEHELAFASFGSEDYDAMRDFG